MLESQTINPNDVPVKQPASDDPLLLIQREAAVVKTFNSLFFVKEPRAWPFLINQLADPNHNRPIPQLGPSQQAVRAKYWNPRTGVSTNPRPLNPKRGQPKKPGDRGYGFTKKTAVTLIPRNGKIHLFRADREHQLGLMFNLNHCYLKDEKYIWTANASSDSRYWLGSDWIHCRRSVGLQGLKDSLRTKESNFVGPEHNEMLIGLSAQALSSIVVTRPELLATRLNALRFQSYVQWKLHKKLPIVCIAQSHSPWIYDAQQQLADIRLVLEDNQLPFFTRRDIPNIFRNMDLQKMQGEVMEEIQKAIAEDHIDRLMQSCLGADENQLLQQLQQNNLMRYLNDDQKKQLLQLTITRNFTNHAQKLLDVGATLGKSASGSPNVLLESFQKGHLEMLDILLARLPQIFENHKVILADAVVACLRDGDTSKVLKMINVAQQTGDFLSDLQQASTDQVNFLTLALQQQPINQSLIQVLAGSGLDFSFPMSSDITSRPLEFAFSMSRLDLVIDIINLMPDQAIQKQLPYLKQIGMQLPVKDIDIDNPKIRSILSDDRKLKFLVDGIRDYLKQDWSGEQNHTVLQQTTRKSVFTMNRLFEIMPLPEHAREIFKQKKEYRDTAFATLQQAIAADHGVDALKKLVWAREQTMFSKHRSTSRLATIGRTSTVIKIDHLINQSLKQVHHEKAALLGTSLQFATDADLIESIQCCQKLLSYELYRNKAKNVQGSFFSRIKQSELNTLTDLHSYMSRESFDAEELSNPEVIRNFCVHLEGIANLTVIDKTVKNRLMEIKSAFEMRFRPDHEVAELF